MTPSSTVPFTPQIAARIERLPLSFWHVRIGLIIGSSWFFDGFDALAIAYVLPAIIRPWHLTPLMIGLMISGGYAGQTIGSVFFGWLAERIGRVPVCLYTLLLWSLTSLLCAFAWDYNSLFAMRFLQGLGLGGEIPIMAAYINEFANSRQRGRFSLSYQTLFSIGLFAVAQVGRYVVPAIGWRWMFVIGAAPALLALPLRRLLPESPRWLASKGRLVEADATLSAIEAMISRNGARPLPPIPPDFPPPKPASSRFRDLFHGIYRRRSFSVWVLWVSSYLVIYGLSTWMPSLWTTVYHLSVQEALNYAAITTSFSLVGAFVNIWLIEAVSRKKLFSTALLLSAMPLLYLAAYTTELAPVWVLVLTMLAFYCNAILAVSLSTYNAELYPNELRALGVGVGNAWLRFASVVGPFFIGFIIPIAGLGAVFLVMGVGVIIGGLTCIFFADETRGQVLEEVSPSQAEA
ncbi:MAG TPA: MFS transporter [Stellaceae bacterium]|nr:MFS transporter [Stellaceae bacterium]